MDPYDFVHLALLALGGEIRGKTKLQKTIYFLGIKTGHINDLGFRPHYYGPYSDVVADAIGRLKSIGLVDQNIVGGGSSDEPGFERCRYDYRLNDDGRLVAEEKKRKEPDLWEMLLEAWRAIEEAGDLDYMKLSLAAKTHFLLSKSLGAATKQKLTSLAPHFGWQVTGSQVEEAAGYLQKLDLVKLASS